MALFKPDPPQPPNPIATAAAQTGTNVATGVANAFLNNVNQRTPQGTLSYDVTDDFVWTDPSTGQNYRIPRFTATQLYSPEQQNIFNSQREAQQNMADLGVTATEQLGSIFGSTFDPVSGAPAPGSADWITGQPLAQTEFEDVGGPQRTYEGSRTGQRAVFELGNAGLQDESNITSTYGPADNYAAERQRVEGDLYARLNPQLDRERANIEQRLADQGIEYGSPAYTRAMDDYNRMANDARLAVTAQGGQEMQRLDDMTARRAGFENAAQMQAYQQAMQNAQLANTAQQQEWQQQYQEAQFGNQAQQQAYAQAANRAEFANLGAAQRLAQAQSGFNAANASRNQYLQEQYARRNQPVNTITSLLSGSQVSQPNWINTPGSQIATTDVAGIINNRFSQGMQIYQQESTNFNQLMGGIFGAISGLGSAGIMRSDRRVKRDIDRVGTVFAANDDGAPRELPIYEYAYKDDPARTRHRGPMAQDVERIDKRAVTTRGGVKHIYPARVMGDIFAAAA